MLFDRRTVVGGVLAAAFAKPARSQMRPVRVGVLTDMSSWGRDNGGPGAVYAVQQAVKEVGGAVAGRAVEVLVGDHRMLPDVGSRIAREWFDSGVDAITDLENSAVGLAVSALAVEKDRICLISGSGSSDITNARCNNRTVAFTYDTYSIAKVTADALAKQGVKTWFFIGADYAFGRQLIADSTSFIQAGGGRVLGTALHPAGTTDYSALLLQAQASKADAIALANSGSDCTNTLKQAQEFGVAQGGQRIATLAMFDTDILAAGLPAVQDTLMVTSAWGNMSPAARHWSEGYYAATGAVPTMMQLGDYGVVKHYLKAVAAAGSTDAGPVMAKMQELPIEDMFCRAGTLRRDGRVIRDMYLMRVKQPAQAALPFDYLELVGTVPGQDAFRPASASACDLLKQ